MATQEDVKELLEAWKGVVAEEMMPIIAASGDRLEGNIYCKCGESRYDPGFLPKQTNMATLARLAASASVSESQSQSHTHTRTHKHKHKHDHKPRVLEIGFNSGFSALLMLMASPDIVMTCVDIASHAYTVPCFQYVARRFPGRIQLIVGDSTKVLPQLMARYARYDLIHIDGCHQPEIATLDVIHSASLGAPGCTYVMDDTDADYIRDIWVRHGEAAGLVPHAPAGLMPTQVHDVRRSPRLAYYTVFCGPTGHIADVVGHPPSNRHPCFYFTDNPITLARASAAGWIAIRLEGGGGATKPVGDTVHDDVASATRAKPLKAAPHLRPELACFEYTIYIDTKRTLDDKGAYAAIRTLSRTGKALLVKCHPSRDRGVGIEFARAMTLPRYAVQRDRIQRYVACYASVGLDLETAGNVWTTLVVRDMRHPVCAEVSDAWMRHIELCGIECQISFYFIRQIYTAVVHVDDTEHDTEVSSHF